MPAPTSHVHREGSDRSRRPTGKPAEDISIIELMWRRRWTLMLCIAVGLSLGAAYLYVATPKYTSSAVIFVRQQLPDNAPTGLQPPPFASATVAAHAEMLRSNTVLSAALEHREVAEALTWEGADPLRTLRKELDVSTGQDKELVTVSFTGPYPVEAATIVNRVVEAYVQAQHNQRQATASATLSRLRKQMGLEELPEEKLQEIIATPTPMDGIAVEGNEQVIAERLQQLADRLTQAQLAKGNAESLWTAAMKSGDNLNVLEQLVGAVGVQVPRDTFIVESELLTRLSAVDQQREALAESFGPKHPRMQTLDRQAAIIRERLEQWRASTASALRLRLNEHMKSTSEQEAQVRAAFEAQQAAAASLDTLPIVVIDPARPATRPSAPQPAKVLGGAMVAGAVLGGLLVLMLDFREHQRHGTTTHARAATLSDADDVDLHEPEMPLLGVVPETTMPALATPEWDVTASSIHHIRAVLQVRARNSGKKSFAITSPRRGSGKTSVSIGLASSMALSGTRTLVIDCDLASRISPAAGSDPNGAGLVDAARMRGYMNGHGSPAVGVAAMIDGHELESCIIESAMENLSILPAGVVQPDHISRMSDRFVEQLLADASELYEMVLIDTGPVPGSVEALLVCSRVEGVLLVAANGESRQRFERTLSYLKVVGARIAGTIFNRAGGDPNGRPTASASADRAAGAGTALARMNGSTAETREDSPNAPFIPRSRPRPPRSSENLGSGILAAAVLSRTETAAEGDKPASEMTAADAGLGELLDEIGNDESRRPNTNGNGRGTKHG